MDLAFPKYDLTNYEVIYSRALPLHFEFPAFALGGSQVNGFCIQCCAKYDLPKINL